MEELQKNMDEVLSISKENFKIILEREKKLKRLEELTLELTASSENFKKKATIPWYEKWKYQLVGTTTIVILLILI